ncbi:MAG: hypothetical protein ACRENP_27415 [Longimicrobiales bacterium]
MRSALADDALPIAMIYNEGIRGRCATFASGSARNHCGIVEQRRNAEIEGLLNPLAGEGAVLWMRRMVLGPTPEFCFETTSRARLPPPLRPFTVTLDPVWPD